MRLCIHLLNILFAGAGASGTGDADKKEKKEKGGTAVKVWLFSCNETLFA